MGIWRCSSASRVSCIQEAGGGGYGAGTRMWGGCGVPSMATAQLARCFIPLHALGPQGSALACRAQHLVQIGARDAQLLRGQLLVAAAACDGVEDGVALLVLERGDRKSELQSPCNLVCRLLLDTKNAGI